ncbi:serine protease [Gandjariella thermophila]|uniref:Serine protease n=1 Tax=Gandjariella thermophila TaxID=1931992 RepID=A0A4D4J7R0_9PSEU|nr:serine protease [Gandjariella thermophila]
MLTALLGGVAVTLSAPAAPAPAAAPALLPELLAQQAATALAARVSADLGTRSAGSFLDPATGVPVVNVLDQADAQQVRERGATPRVVAYGTDALQEAEADLDRTGGAPSTAWGVDPATDQVVLTVSDATPKDGADRLLAAARKHGNRVRVQRISGPITEQLSSGDDITTGMIRCSVGFAVHRGGTPHLLTAGHCTRGLPQWINVGPSVDSHFPGSDYGLILDETAQGRGVVNLYNGGTQRITAAGNATVGQSVCKSGRTTHLTCGKITALNQTVNYGNGDVVRGLIRAEIRCDKGDSGGALFAGSVGLGTLSGGDGHIEYFQPLPQSLRAYGATLG